MPLAVELDRSSPVPLYYQLAQAIEAAIRDGELTPGDRFENELALAKRLTLSRPTTRRAIQELVDKGLLVRKRGVGTQVVQNPVHRRVELTSLYRRPDAGRPGTDHSAARLPRRAARRGGRTRAEPDGRPRRGVNPPAALCERRAAGGDDEPPACGHRAGTPTNSRPTGCISRCAPAACTSGWLGSGSAHGARPAPRPSCSTKNPVRRC